LLVQNREMFDKGIEQFALVMANFRLLRYLILAVKDRCSLLPKHEKKRSVLHFVSSVLLTDLFLCYHSALAQCISITILGLWNHIFASKVAACNNAPEVNINNTSLWLHTYRF
jgi:hypothetical protein